MSRPLIIALTIALGTSACSASDGSGLATEASRETTTAVDPTTTSHSPTSTTEPVGTTSTTATTLAPESTTTSIIDPGWDTRTLPPFLLADGAVVHEISDGRAEVVTGVDGTAARAFATSTGVVLVDEIVEADYPSVHQYTALGPGADNWVLPTAPGYLLDLVEIGGLPHIVYVDGEDANQGARLLWLRDLTTGDDIELGSASDSEFGVYGASVGGQLIAISAVADLTEIIYFRSIDGEEVDVSSPTDELAYNSPPFMGPARLSPDGTLMAYVEQPDTSLDSPSIPVGDTSLVIIDVGSGEEELRILVPGVDGVEALDYDGRWVALSNTIDDEVVPALVDTGSPAIEIIDLGDLRGVLSLG